MSFFQKISPILFLIIFTNLCLSSEISYRMVFNEKGEEVGEILIKDKVVIWLTEKEGFSSLKIKTEIIRQRLFSLKAQNILKPENIKLGIYKNKVVITVKDFLLITVSGKEAKRSNLTPHQLGEIWVKNLKEALTPPTLIIPAKQMNIPLYEERSFLLSGTAKGDVLFNYDKNLIDVNFDYSTNIVTIKTLSTGKTTLGITREGITISLDLIIKKYAGYILKKGEIYLTGNPCPQDLIREAVMRETRKCISLEENAYSYILEENLNIPSYIDRGDELKIKVPVKMEGKDYFTFKGNLEIKVMNEPLPFQDAECLLISNSPENIKEESKLIDTFVTEDTPLRLLYHHRNSTNKSLDFLIVLLNEEDIPQKVHIIKGETGPSKNEIYTGYLATYKFIQNYFNNAGEIILISPKSYYVLLSKTMPSSYLLSGIFQIRIFNKGKIYLQIKAQSSYLTPNIFLGDTPGDVFPHFEWTRKGIYPQTKIAEEYEYVVDKKWCFINIGENAVLNGEGRRLLGNYGILYDVKLKLINPTPYYKKVKIYFSPAGGLSQGIFLIDGEIKISKLLNYDAEERLMTWTLHPEEVRIVQIKTMPQPGANYPIRLIVRK